MRCVRFFMVVGIAIIGAMLAIGAAQAGPLYFNVDMTGPAAGPTYTGQGAYATPGNYWNVDNAATNVDSEGNAVDVNCYVGLWDGFSGGSYIAPAGDIYAYADNDLLCDYYYSHDGENMGIGALVTGLVAGKVYDITVYGATPYGSGGMGEGSKFTLEAGEAATTELICSGLRADWDDYFVEGVSYVTFHNVTAVEYTYDEDTYTGAVIRSHVVDDADNCYFVGLQVAEIVPEPSMFILLGCGLIGLLCYAWRKRK